MCAVSVRTYRMVGLGVDVSIGSLFWYPGHKMASASAMKPRAENRPAMRCDPTKHITRGTCFQLECRCLFLASWEGLIMTVVG